MSLLIALPLDLLTLFAVLFLLLGVPAILFGLILLYTGYVRYDAERYLEELETADEAARTGSTGQDASSARTDGQTEGEKRTATSNEVDSVDDEP